MLPLYQKRAAEFSARATALQARYEKLGWVRLLSFLALVAVIILVWRETPWWSGMLTTGLGIFAFARLVRWHGRIQADAQHQQQLARLNTAEAQGQNNDFSAFSVGTDFVDPQHPYSYDMDLFGPYSLFQMVNRGNTSIGQARLASWLQDPSTNDVILERQAAGRDLAQQLEWQHHLRAYGAALEEEDGQIDRLYDWLKEPFVVEENTLRKVALWVAPLLFIVSMALWVTVWPWYQALLLLIPAGLWLRNSLEEIQKMHTLTGRAADTLRRYGQLISHIETAQFEAPKLKSLQAVFTEGDVSASQAIHKLAYRVSQLDVRYNAFVFLLEFSIVWDLQQAYRMDKWKLRHRDRLPQWFEALAELEALVSFGNLTMNQPQWIFPTLQEERQLHAEALGHPLLPNDKRVTNDISMPTAGHMHLLTGSNMAGKSTWLRTVGINIVLALAGAPVCARVFRLPQLQVYTSMRTQDALHESTSSFYAELKRLKFIIEAVEDPSKTAGRPVFFLLDEILKGTNSRDRHTGSKALIRQLIASKGAGIIATHDLELGELEAEANNQIENWAIEVDIKDGQLFFDYKLKRGVSQSFNATLLMQQMGIKV
jgi:DNA mismatch repair ATPase MutS